MNDRYLSKAKRTDNGEWVEGYLINDDCGCFIMPENYISERQEKNRSYGYELILIKAFEVDPDTVCQCTGFKDKNDALIWENDIVRHDMSDTIGTVKWYKEDYVGWCVDDIQVNQQRFTDEMWDECEVIGNVIDNPELLEV